jgi:hypothetical protein
VATPLCKAEIARIRARVTDRVVGKLTRHALTAVDQISALAKKGEQESIRLSAAKSLLEQLIQVSNHVKAEKQITELVSRIAQLEAALENQSSDHRTAE